MDNTELVTVYTLGNPIKAEIIKNYLDSEGIQCFLDGINQAAEAGLNALEINIQVRSEDAERARHLLKEHDAAQSEEQ